MTEKSTHEIHVIFEPQKYSQQISSPGSRINHTVSFFNDNIFVLGGISSSNFTQDEHYRVVHWYSIENRQWFKKEFSHLVKNEEKEREIKENRENRDNRENRENRDNRDRDEEYYSTTTTRSLMASCQKDHHLYLFGGSNSKSECQNELLLLNLKKIEWEFPKNENPPPPREAASMCFIENINCLLLYGGMNVLEPEIYNTFYCYGVESGAWREVGVEVPVIHPRYLASMCCIAQENKILIYGGEFVTPEGIHYTLSDMYEVSVLLGEKGQTQAINNIYTSLTPHKKTQNTNPLDIRINVRLVREYDNGCGNLGVWIGGLTGRRDHMPQNPSNNQSSMISEVKEQENIQQQGEGMEMEIEVPEKQSTLAIPLSTRRRARSKINGLYEHLEQSEQKELEAPPKTHPYGGSAPKLLALDQNYLVLIPGTFNNNNTNTENGENNDLYLSTLWIYSISHNKWKSVPTPELQRQVSKTGGIEFGVATMGNGIGGGHLGEKFLQRENGFKREGRAIREKERERMGEGEGYGGMVGNWFLYGYGGVGGEEMQKSELFFLKFELVGQPQPQISEEDDKVSKTKIILDTIFATPPLEHCNYCDYPEEVQLLPKFIINQITTLITHPFTAIGLLLSNSSHYNSTYFSVGYVNQHMNLEHRVLAPEGSLFECKSSAMLKGCEPYLHVIENNQLKNVDFEELKDVMTNFEYLFHFSYHNMEKKVKVTLQKEHQLREFGLYTKIAALRLGEEFVYITKGNKDEIRVFAFLITSDKQSFEFHSYIYDVRTKKEIFSQKNQKSENSISFKKINEKYSVHINNIYIKYGLEDENNHLLIFNLRQMEVDYPEESDKYKNGQKEKCHEIYGTSLPDIRYSLYRNTKFFNKDFIGFSIDASLSVYMSSYFLKNEFPKISVRFNKIEKYVMLQQCLEHYDKLVTDNYVYEVDNSTVNIEIKFMELYFNPSLDTRIPYFVNGVLFYHQGKLVTRYECPIGDLYKRFNPKYENFFSLFGLLEVPEAIHPNIFRTVKCLEFRILFLM